MQHSCLSMQVWYSVWLLLCRVQYACCTIQYSCLDIELHARVTRPWVGRPLDKVCGLKVIAPGVPAPFHMFQHSCLSMQVWYSVWLLLCRVRYACCTIQYSCLDIELHARVTRPWVGRPLDKVCGLKVIAPGVPAPFHMFQVTQWWRIVVPLGKHLRTTRRPHFVAWQSNC